MLAMLAILAPASAQTLTCAAGDTLCEALDEAALAVNASLGYDFLHDGSGSPARASMPVVLNRLRAASQDAVAQGCTVQHWVGSEYGRSRFEFLWDAVGDGSPQVGVGRRRGAKEWLGLAVDSGPMGGWYAGLQVVGVPGVDPTPGANDLLVGQAIRIAGVNGVVIAANLTCDPGVDTLTAADGWFQRDLTTLVPTEVPVDITLRDLSTTAPIVGATVTTPDGAQVTDAAGHFGFTAPPYGTEPIPVVAAGYPSSLLHVHSGAGLSATRVIPSNAAIAGLAGALGITIDPSKAILSYSVFDFDGFSTGLRLGGVQVDLDVPYSVALVSNDASPFGFSPGNVTLDGSPSTVVFVNVEAGPVNTSITPPAGYWCWAGDEEFDHPAGNYVMAGGSCVAL
ncbi:MAG: hypothetical protein H6736_22760 [Alphaproteobacteria bacterium]|nr:hypothetical protein [Alphaproteobacteria bacterium]MCB9694642.1 hypothetical protein [Alphaproteobacteria bacterium]